VILSVETIVQVIKSPGSSTAVPISVAIDESLALAKELSSDESSKYIHGVLGRIASIKDTISI